MLYRRLYYFTSAFQRGEATDVVDYLAGAYTSLINNRTLDL